MKHPLKSAALFIAAALFVAAPAVFAHEGHKGEAVPATNADPAWLAKARAEYPLTSCAVSGDKLGGDMGEAVDYIYKQEGKPDRLVRFCCKDCIDDFKKEPAKFLAKIDEAAAAKAKAAPKK